MSGTGGNVPCSHRRTIRHDHVRSGQSKAPAPCTDTRSAMRITRFRGRIRCRIVHRRISDTKERWRPVVLPKRGVRFGTRLILARIARRERPDHGFLKRDPAPSIALAHPRHSSAADPPGHDHVPPRRPDPRTFDTDSGPPIYSAFVASGGVRLRRVRRRPFRHHPTQHRSRPDRPAGRSATLDRPPRSVSTAPY
jgi:hypothetical protein